MQINLQCPVCKFGLAKKLNHGSNRIVGKNYSIYPNPDDNVIFVSCIKHNSVVYFENLKFDLLFESGLKAIKDYYYREAIASVTASLERFYEYIIRYLLYESVELTIYQDAWKEVSKLSERQLGAFSFLFLREFGIPPKILSSDDASFRNNVIHKGYFPNEKETLSFTSKVASIITDNFKSINGNKEKIEKFNNLLRNEFFTSAKAKITEIELRPEYDSKSKIRVAKHPFPRKIPTFFGNLESDLPKIEELSKYIIEQTKHEVD